MLNIEDALGRLHRAIAADKPRKRCLTLWSDFIRLRDGYRCVDCHSKNNLAAHHICRKSFLPVGAFDTGNGITLCKECHQRAHLGFNGRVNFALPVDAQGGEKLELMERYYCILLQDAIERDTLTDEHYHLSDSFLNIIKRMQGYGPRVTLAGTRLEQVNRMLASTEQPLRDALAAANGLSAPSSFSRSGLFFTFDSD